MAKPAWLSISPATGSGNGTISNSASPHTGRVARTGVVTVQGTGVSTPSTYNVTQTPKPEFVSFDNGAEISAPKAGGLLTIEGKSNSSKLTFALVDGGDITIELPAKYNVNGTATNNSASITGDPGSVAEFTFAIELTIPANLTIADKQKSISVTANGGQTAQITIKQSAGDAQLSVAPTSITIPQDGSSVSVTVTANCPWSAS